MAAPSPIAAVGSIDRGRVDARARSRGRARRPGRCRRARSAARGAQDRRGEAERLPVGVRARGSRRARAPVARSAAKRRLHGEGDLVGAGGRRLGGAGDGEGGVAERPRRRGRGQGLRCVIMGCLRRRSATYSGSVGRCQPCAAGHGHARRLQRLEELGVAAVDVGAVAGGAVVVEPGRAVDDVHGDRSARGRRARSFLAASQPA